MADRRAARAFVRCQLAASVEDTRPSFFARDGRVWRRSAGFPEGCLLHERTATNLLTLFEAESWSASLAAELRAAIHQADEQKEDVHA